MKASKAVYLGVSAGGYPWFKVDHWRDHTNYTIVVHEQGDGNITYKIQGTVDDLEVDSSARAFDLVSGVAASGPGPRYHLFVDTPLAAVRLFVAVSGSANATFTVMQNGW